MSERAEQIFHRLTTVSAVLSLIGQSEDSHLDCKEWPPKPEDAQRVFAKAACGLTNAEGGVLVVGMKAKSISKDEPDLIESPAPVTDTSAVKSRILDLVGQLVEPGIEGVLVTEINEPLGSKSGFVVAYIPASDGSPRRSKKDGRFYLRIGSGTFPMDYFQIAEMFGRQAKPKLDLYLEATGKIGPIPFDSAPHRFFWLGLSNTGRGLAKFPGIRFKRTGSGLALHQYGLDGNNNLGLPSRASEHEWVIFRGGVDDVIYPGSTLKITQLLQRESFELIGRDPVSKGFEAVTFEAEISGEGVPTITVQKVIPLR
jgi:Putative DNA-binding domain